MAVLRTAWRPVRRTPWGGRGTGAAARWGSRLWRAALAAALLGACSAAAADPGQEAPGLTLAARETAAAARAQPGPRPGRLYGVTIDDVSELPAIVQSLARLSKRPTARIVFDEGRAPGDYRDAALAIHQVSDVMGEILDSQFVHAVSVPAYLERTRRYLDTLGDVVDIWEVGNEINGEWLGRSADTAAKMSGAYDLVKARGKTAALTLYYNAGCVDDPSHEMFAWAAAHVPERMRQGLDYVLISYYEDDCHGLRPDWPAVFRRLGTLFPSARLGFGEVGTAHAGRKADYLTRYYRMKIDHPRFIGGYFWWYFRQDMVPFTRPLWRTLDAALAGP